MPMVSAACRKEPVAERPAVARGDGAVGTWAGGWPASGRCHWSQGAAGWWRGIWLSCWRCTAGRGCGQDGCRRAGPPSPARGSRRRSPAANQLALLPTVTVGGFLMFPCPRPACHPGAEPRSPSPLQDRCRQRPETPCPNRRIISTNETTAIFGLGLGGSANHLRRPKCGSSGPDKRAVNSSWGPLPWGPRYPTPQPDSCSPFVSAGGEGCMEGRAAGGASSWDTPGDTGSSPDPGEPSEARDGASAHGAMRRGQPELLCLSAPNMQGASRSGMGCGAVGGVSGGAVNLRGSPAGSGVAGTSGSVPVTLRPPPQSATVQGLKLPARVSGRVQGRQVALEGPGRGAGEREGGLNSRAPLSRLPVQR